MSTFINQDDIVLIEETGKTQCDIIDNDENLVRKPTDFSTSPDSIKLMLINNI